MQVDYARSFKKEYNKLPLKLKKQFAKRLALFVADPFHPILHNHALHGEFDIDRSINMTGDVRALYYTHKGTAIFVRIDTHANLYG